MILFDLSHSLHRTVAMNHEPIHENINFVGHLVLTQVVSYSRRLGASKENPFVICMDSKPSWRHQYYLDNRHKFDDIKDQTYKGNRKVDSTLPWDDIKRVADEICMALKDYSDFHVLKIDRCEADDIIASLAMNSSGEVWVVSSDKDFVQLQSDRVKIFDPLKQAFKPEQNVEIFKKLHVMVGDKSDNIPSFKPRVAEKTAIKLLPELSNILATNPLLRERYEFNENLILFEKIPQEIHDTISQYHINEKHSFNAMQLMKVFMKYGLAKHIEDINAFKLVETVGRTKITSTFDVIKKNEELAKTNFDDFFA